MRFKFLLGEKCPDGLSRLLVMNLEWLKPSNKKNWK